MRERNRWPRFSLRFLLIVVTLCSLVLAWPHVWRTVEYYRLAEDLDVLRAQLKNPEYRWYGPTSREYRIPVLHAARGLAFLGDEAVPILVEAGGDPEIDIISIYDALSEIGIPVHQFHAEIMDRKMTAVKKWWRENADATRFARSKHRQQIGLPPLR